MNCNRVIHIYKRVTTTIAGLLGLLVLGVIFLQITSRYIGWYNFPWTEEVARFIFIWCVAFFVGPAYLSAAYIRVDFLAKKIGLYGVVSFENIIHGLIFIFSIVLSCAGYVLMIKTGEQLSPAAGWKVVYINSAVLFIGINLSICSGIMMLGLYNKTNHKSGNS